MNGFCSHCGQTGLLWRYRLTDVGLRWLLPTCFERLSAMGMNIEAVTEEPRQVDMGIAWRRSGSKAMVRRLLGAA